MCTCTETILAEIQRKTGDTNAFLDTTTFGQFSAAFKTIQIRYWYRPTMRNGKLAYQKKTQRIKPTFCPFCGERYEQVNEFEV